MGLGKYEGKSFTFGEVFSCNVENGVCWIQQYYEGKFSLPHIKTEAQFIQLYETLTGVWFDPDEF